MVCAIKKQNALLDFEGYSDATSTQKKIIENPLPGVKCVYNSGIDISFAFHKSV